MAATAKKAQNKKFSDEGFLRALCKVGTAPMKCAIKLITTLMNGEWVVSHTIALAANKTVQICSMRPKVLIEYFHAPKNINIQPSA